MDKDYIQLYAGDIKILQNSIENNKMQYVWDEEWVSWGIFQNDDDVKKMFVQSEKLLDDSGKGKSKGKNGH